MLSAFHKVHNANTKSVCHLPGSIKWNRWVHAQLPSDQFVFEATPNKLKGLVKSLPAGCLGDAPHLFNLPSQTFNYSTLCHVIVIMKTTFSEDETRAFVWVGMSLSWFLIIPRH